MAIIAKQSGNGDFQLAPEGQFAAICHKVIDCGTQTVDGQYGVQQKRQVIIGFELHGENQIGDGSGYMEDGRPHVVQQKFTLSLGEKSKLRPFLQSWRGRPFTDDELEGFDISKLIAAPCMVTIQHVTSVKGKTFANITGITPKLKSIETPRLANQATLFEIDPWDQVIFESLSKGLQDYISKSEEYQNRFGSSPSQPVDSFGDRNPPPVGDDDIPF
ncbi:hypothetical protein [Methylopila sp. 73B]|uniref:phage replication initiation protein, NGO0469 family n=1 Tax=Methylopila sp. 73B TaxID=1120792 RepID=UPI00039C7FB4|nr:hypothetical protein [Methylopila sp. 73B]